MVDRDAGPRPYPPGNGDPAVMDTAANLALNRVGSFDWDLGTGRLLLDGPALDLFDLLPEEYDQDPGTLARRVPVEDTARLDQVVTDAVGEGRATYGMYFRIRRREGRLMWAHTQGHVLWDDDGHAYRILGVVRDATQELSHAAERAALEEVRRQQTAVVEETAVALARAVTVQDVIGVLKETRGIGRADPVSVVMGLVENNRVHVVAEGQAGSWVPGLEYTGVDQEYPMSEVVRTGELCLVRSRGEFAARYPLLWPHLEPLDVGSAVYLPLIAQGRPLGAIGLLYSVGQPFSPEDRNLLVSFSSSIAQSLQRAILYDQEHDIAEGLQTAMLPRIPPVPGAEVAVRYSAARLGRDVGGDWYDVIPLPGGRVGAVIGDVEGHDTHAAAIMGQLRIALRAYAAEGHAPATVVARASYFLDELDTERFATCTYVDADPVGGGLRIVRAGHLDPLLRQADGNCRQLPVAGGLPLGLSARFGRNDYPVSSVELGPQETLLLYTDGLVEQPGTDLDEGVRMLIDAVRKGPFDVEELADRMLRTMKDRTGEDDMALLLMSRTGAEPGPAARARTLHQYITPADPESLATARDMIREAVRSWEAEERAEDVVLVADELVTNSLVHTEGGAVVTALMFPGPERRLRIEVQDRSSGLPRRREPGEAGTSGRGLLLVDLLADVWGVESRGSGKAVWCEFVCGRAE
ncbi:SpoIIE family protein phosphatase [Streptomyces lycii]|uniref:SpoIIE family protein phosphatase n=1 Tax=Streptomyces lycii TaxID=2654337 RepID=A0ABQ7F9W2_9ACTN|nr:SpoIIE family protein phosphatase [Streptomyces lycii]